MCQYKNGENFVQNADGKQRNVLQNMLVDIVVGLLINNIPKFILSVLYQPLTAIFKVILLNDWFI